MMKKILQGFLLSLLLMISLPNLAYADSNRSIHDEIIYDILVDRLINGRQAPSEEVDINDPLAYHGGDLKGVTMMLDIIEEHGFTAISLSPIMKNARKGYHGYWIEDFTEVEEEFGSLEDLQELVEEAHKREIKVLLEFVPNYLAKSSPLAQDPDKQAWFKEVQANAEGANEWLNEVVQFDHTNEAAAQYIIDSALYWLDAAQLDGLVIQAADQASVEFLEVFSQAIKEKDPKAYLIAKSLDGQSLDHLCPLEGIDAIAAENLFAAIQEVFAHVDTPVSKLYEISANAACDKMLLFADHKNSARFANVIADQGRNAVTAWTLALSYLYLTPGVPIVYQGSEVPMYGPGFPENQKMVESMSADPDLKKIFERLASARSMFPPLVHGDFEQVAQDEGFSLFKRTLGDQVVYVGINNDSRSRVVKVNDLDEGYQLRGLFHDDTIRPNDEGDFVIGLNRESAEVFVIQPNFGLNWGFIGLIAGIMFIFINVIIYLSMKQRRREKNSSN